MHNNNSVLKYEIPYKGQFLIMNFWANSASTLQMAAIKIRYNIHLIKPYKSDINIDFFLWKQMFDDVTSGYPSYILIFVYTYIIYSYTIYA